MAQQFQTRVLDTVLVNLGTYTSDPDLEPLLGSANGLAIHSVIDQVPNACNLSIEVLHSSDRVNWSAVTAAFVFALSTSATTSDVRYIPDTTALLGFVRVRLSFSPAGSTFSSGSGSAFSGARCWTSPRTASGPSTTMTSG